MIAASIALSNLFLNCYLGKVSTESFQKMSVCLYETEWCKLRVELQKYFIIMIANTQKPLYYDGFSVITLNLETFCDVNLALKLASECK